MAAPEIGDVLVRRQHAGLEDHGQPEGYLIVEFASRAFIMGPFASEAIALGVAQSLATKRSRHAWTERLDDQGRLVGAQRR
jgi:hypothetical protein